MCALVAYIWNDLLETFQQTDVWEHMSIFIHRQFNAIENVNSCHLNTLSRFALLISHHMSVILSVALNLSPSEILRQWISSARATQAHAVASIHAYENSLETFWYRISIFHAYIQYWFDWNYHQLKCIYSYLLTFIYRK